MGTMTWHPKWWNNETHGTTWEKVKAAMKRDWEQTKSDMGVKGAKDLGQDVGDTVKQATGTEPIPWEDVETPLAYGYGAHQHMSSTGAHTHGWDDKVESSLKEEWEKGREATRRGWEDVKAHVRHGYESFKH